MTEMKGSEDFVHYIDFALKDGLLSEKEWAVHLEEAASNLSAEQVKRLVVERCVEKGAVIEHFEVQRLRDLIAIAAPDKVLEASVQALLRRLAEERYHLTRLASPQAHVNRLVSERLQEAKLWEEQPLRQKISERLLAAAGAGRSLRIEDWRRIYIGMLQELGISSDGPSDLVGLFLDCRRELRIEIVESQPKAPPPEPPQELPQPPAPPPPVKPVAPEPSQPPEPSSALASLGRLVLISLAVALLVFFLLRFIDRGEESESGTSVAVVYPECDDECVKNLKIWTKGLREDPSSGVLERAVKECEPYLELPETMKSEVKAADPDWALCEAPEIAGEFNNRVGHASG